jgi:hypothetical protein
LAAVLGWLVLAHFFYHGIGGNRYGPRHYYEAATAILILTASVIFHSGRHGILMLAAVLLMNIAQYASSASYFSSQVRERTEVFELVKKQGISNAIVFLSTGSGSMPRGDLARNGIHFDQSVLYVHDLGDENVRLMRRYPSRKAYYYVYSQSTRSGSLLPFPAGD